MFQSCGHYSFGLSWVPVMDLLSLQHLVEGDDQNKIADGAGSENSLSNRP